MNVTDERWREFVKTFAPKSDEEMAKLYRQELRDRFAMAALTGLLADHTMQNFSVTEFADLSYEYADAMLGARGND